MSKGTLYLFPSQLSAGDVSAVLPQRNIVLISSVKYFVVEELRTARRFLKACNREIDIDSLHFEVLNEHTSPTEIEAMAEPLERGFDVGIISEAGCPAVADPGADLVAVAQRRGIKVVPLVGPSSILLSLMASGFNGQEFAFRGYLPVDAQRRQAVLRDMEKAIAQHRRTQIFIETPYRNLRLLEDLKKSLPTTMRLCIGCDITGASERIITKPLGDWKVADLPQNKVPAIFLLYS